METLKPSGNWNPADSGAELRKAVDRLTDLRHKRMRMYAAGEVPTLEPSAEEAAEIASIKASMKESAAAVPKDW